jgi:uncharacterized membrane protein YdbT with pleckstrin-like domain
MDETAERVCIDLRCHGVVLARPLLQALVVAAAGFLLLFAEWPVPVVGAVLAGVAAIGALAAVWRWDATRLVITTEKVFLVHGVLRRRASAVLLRAVRDVGVEQSLAGRALGYGTLHAGPLEVEFVPQVQRVCDLVERLAA